MSEQESKGVIEQLKDTAYQVLVGAHVTKKCPSEGCIVVETPVYIEDSVVKKMIEDAGFDLQFFEWVYNETSRRYEYTIQVCV